jgi:hypothetical protein
VFRAGVQNHHEPLTVINATPGAAPIPFQYDIPAYGFLRRVYIRVVVTGGAGGGAVYRLDAPFSWIQTIQFLDVNSTPIIFQVTGHDLYLFWKYGGFANIADPKSDPNYTQGGANGNSVFILPIPLEIRQRDGLGALPNKNNATAYKILGSIAPTTEVYSTAPVTPPTNVQLSLIMEAWWEPEATDLRGRPQAQVPPGNNTTQYLAKQVFTNASGALTNQIKRVGYLDRNLFFVQRDQASPPVRSATIFPDPAIIVYEGQQLTILPRWLWQQLMVFWYGVTGAAEAAGGPDTGVYVLPFTLDFWLGAGAELANGYLPTTSATRLELQGTASAAGILSVLTNDVAARDEAEISAS